MDSKRVLELADGLTPAKPMNETERAVTGVLRWAASVKAAVEAAPETPEAWAIEWTKTGETEWRAPVGHRFAGDDDMDGESRPPRLYLVAKRYCDGWKAAVCAQNWAGYPGDGGKHIEIEFWADPWAVDRAGFPPALKTLEEAQAKAVEIWRTTVSQESAAAGVITRERELAAARSLASEAGLHEALSEVLASAVPHPREHPTMTKAWAKARAALKATEGQPAALNAPSGAAAVSAPALNAPLGGCKVGGVRACDATLAAIVKEACDALVVMEARAGGKTGAGGGRFKGKVRHALGRIVTMAEAFAASDKQASVAALAASPALRLKPGPRVPPSAIEIVPPNEESPFGEDAGPFCAVEGCQGEPTICSAHCEMAASPAPSAEALLTAALREREAELHTQDGHDGCEGECDVARLLVHLDESRKIALEERAKVAEAREALEQVKAALGDRLLGKGPLSKEYAHSVMRQIDAALQPQATQAPAGSEPRRVLFIDPAPAIGSYLLAGSVRGHVTHGRRPGERVSLCGETNVRPADEPWLHDSYACKHCLKAAAAQTETEKP